jgi:hypothetical protein
MSRTRSSCLLLISLASALLVMTPLRLSAETNYCSLITPQEAATELHAASTVAKGDSAPTSTPGTPVKFQSCTFTTPGAIPNTLRISFRIAPSAAVAHQSFQSEKQILDGIQKVSSLTGIGDEAVWNPNGQIILFCKHSVCAQIQGGADPFKYNDGPDRLRALATSLAAKLP